ncbi:MAG: DUF1211 domain-containing protein [Candidatus Eremiobacteraeota bacterium]|nr:DUF1211 domain-containing protein [Candidatus Eremiobacteraeota bacterium]
MRVEERDQHTVHRLEAFSDIVIGFCLAQAAVNLALPKGADGSTVWLNANFLLVSFGLVAVLWWLHHRTFSTLFVLTPGTVLLNFAILGSLVLSLYLLQVFIHAVASGQGVLLFLRLWIASYLLVYALMGALMLAGIVLRRGSLPADDLRWAVNRLVVVVASVLFLGYLTFSGFAAHPHGIIYISLAWALIMMLVGRVIVPLLLRTVIPDGS